MYVHPIRPDAQARPVPVELREVEPRVAVLLNANAKRVNEKVRHALSHVVPEGDLFMTRSFEEAREVAAKVVDRRYQVVFTGGGDGTFVGFFNEICNAIEQRRAANPFLQLRPPRFGILKLGTGNCLANLCGSSPLRGDGIVDDVLLARAGGVPGIQPLELLQTEGKRAPFAGVGIDAGILNHFMEVKRSTAKMPFGKLFSGAGGYATAITARSVPHYLTQRRPNIEVRCRGSAYRIGADGRPTGNPMGPGAVLYSGPALMCAASTIPCYGFNFKLFPFAGTRRGMMQVRIANVSIAKTVAHLYPEVWQGRWRDPNLFDFFCDDVEIKVDRKVPFQIGGDAEGYRDYVRFTTMKQTVELLDFNSAARA